MRDGHAKDLPVLIAAGEQRLTVLDPEMDLPADEMQPGVAHQDARQQPSLGQHLKAIADAELHERPAVAYHWRVFASPEWPSISPLVTVGFGRSGNCGAGGRPVAARDRKSDG